MECLLKALNLSNYTDIFKQNEVDGLTLYNCHSTEDVKELGITMTAKARVLFSEITKYKLSGNHSKQLSSSYTSNTRV